MHSPVLVKRSLNITNKTHVNIGGNPMVQATCWHPCVHPTQQIRPRNKKRATSPYIQATMALGSKAASSPSTEPRKQPRYATTQTARQQCLPCVRVGIRSQNGDFFFTLRFHAPYKNKRAQRLKQRRQRKNAPNRPIIRSEREIDKNFNTRRRNIQQNIVPQP